MPRKTHPRQSKQAPRKQTRHPKVHTTVVKPVGRCPGPTGKLQFATPEIAEEALREARAYKTATGNTGRIEKRYYECPDCGLYHLTHREKWVDRQEEEPS